MTSLHYVVFLLPIWIHTVLGSSLVAELYVVVDPQIVRNYVNLGYSQSTAMDTLQNDMDFLIYQVNQHFSSMQSGGLDIQIRVKKMDVMTDEVFEDCKLVQSKYLQADLALEVFRAYLEDNKVFQTIDYDIALVLTGYDLFRQMGSYQESGYATLKAACNGEVAVSVVEYDGTQQTAVVIAHELAHSLGSGHDASFACPSAAGYIMTPVASPSNPNRWDFSQCSMEDVNTYMNEMSTGGSNCLTETVVEDPNFDMSSQAGQDILDPQKICQRKLGNADSYFCAYKSLYGLLSLKGDPLCQTIYCAPKGTLVCQTTTPTEGMVCDAGKRCEKGQCVAAPPSLPTPSSVTTDCVYGDIQANRLFGENITCPDYISRNGLHRCYSSNVFELCCATCRAQRMDIDDCEYGDKSTDCSNYPAEAICPAYKHICCHTCRNYRRKRSSIDETTDLPRIVPDSKVLVVETPTVVNEVEGGLESTA